MAKQHKPVQVLIKPASADCNLACRYCFYLDKASLYPGQQVHRMAPEVQEEMISQIIQYGGESPSFAYQGGEPTIMGLPWFKRAVELQKKYALPGQTICNSIQTNGLLIDEEWCAFLAQYHFLVGLSIDGPAHIHDANRVRLGGSPSHAAAITAARLMDEYGVEYNILSVVSSASAPHAREIYNYFRENRWQYLQFIPAVEHDPATGAIADFSVNPEAYGRFMCEIFDEWKKDFKDGIPSVSVRLFDSILSLYCNAASPSCTMRKTCGIYVVIEHNGDIYSCDFFVEPQWKLGNLMSQSLRALLESPRQREFGKLKANLPGACERCEWLNYCRGGCIKDRMRSGRPGEIGLDYFCEANRMILGHTRETMLELRKKVFEMQQREKPEE